MSPLSDYNFGKIRHQEFEAEVSRYAHREASLGQANLQLATSTKVVAVLSVFAAFIVGAQLFIG